MDKITLKAPAKINLALDIIKKLDNGYHQLKMIMQSIALADVITIKKNNSQNINITCTHSGVPEDRNNLAYQAAELILKKADLKTGVDIYINKKIPVAAGLGGGSTDAAAILKGINYIFSLKFSREILKSLGARIGMDVPFCLEGGTALATGMGEKLTLLPDLSSWPLIIINPSFKLNTVEVYNKYDRILKKEDIRVKVPTSKLINIIQSKQKIDWDEGWINVLEPVAEQINKDIKNIKKILKTYNPLHVMMTGSGPTVFGILEDKEQVLKIKDTWPREQDTVFVSTMIEKLKYQQFRQR